MAKLKSFGLIFLVPLLVGIITAPSAFADNLLTNGYFEENPTSPTIAGWHTATESGPARYDNMQVYSAREGVRNYTFEGENAVIITTQDHGTEPFVANLYQQVSGVTPGTDYSFSGWSLAFWGGSGRFPDDQLHTDKIGRVVGIDPYGGTDPASANIVWGKERWKDGKRQNIYTAATAMSSTITVFIHVTNTGGIDHSTCILDSYYLSPAPRIQVDPLPAYQTEPTMNVSWRLLSIPPDTNFSDFEVDFRIDDSDWDGVDLSSDNATSFTFPGEDGHTYTFRVRARSRLDEWPNNRIAGNFGSGTVQTTISTQGPPPSTATPEPTAELPTSTTAPSFDGTPQPVYIPVMFNTGSFAQLPNTPYPAPATATNTPLPLPTPVPIQTNTPAPEDNAISQVEPSTTPTIDIGEDVEFPTATPTIDIGDATARPTATPVINIGSPPEEATITPTIDIGEPAASEATTTPTIDVGTSEEEPTNTPTIDVGGAKEPTITPTIDIGGADEDEDETVPSIGVPTNTPVLPLIIIPTATPMGGGVLSPTGFGAGSLLTGLLFGGLVILSRLLRSIF